MTRTGIFGGSFNPIHNGHIALARELLELAHLDEIWFVVGLVLRLISYREKRE